SADPASGAAVNAGDTVTYTVTAENTGDTVLDPVSVSDDLSAVLSSAEYNDDVKASVGTASVAENTLSWNGTLAPGASVTITYSVTVNEDATGVLLHNVVEGAGTPLIPEDPSDPESPTTPGDPITPPPAETEHPVVNPGFAVSKSADPASGAAVNAGDTVTYTVTAENTGDTVLDPVSVSDNLAEVLAYASYNGDVSATTGDVSITGDELSWNGALPAGERAVITYSVTVNSDASGELLSNVADGTGTPQIPEDPSDPESPTTPGDPIAPPPAETEHPVNTPGFELSKSVDPASGSTVDTGNVLRYTVTGENTGETVLDPVSITDDLSEVLAHATYNGDAAAAINGVPVAAPTVAGEELSWNGVLEAEQTVTITYSVTVGPEAAGENLVNVVTAEATPPGGDENTIVPPPVETDNPVNVPGFSVSKSADPEAGSRVDPGSVVRYTVTGVNTGETALDPVSIVDNLSGVLAHADYNDDVAASMGSATLEGDELVWNGALGIGERVSITYSVTVHGDAGGETLRNAVAGIATPPGDAPPIETPESTTEHPVNEPGFEIAKSANPATGDAVDPGSVITYTVTGVNTGQTVLSPVEISDDLSGVFAHASYNGDVTASNGEALVNDEKLHWQGELGIGKRISITYSVTVNSDAGGTTVRNTVSGEATSPGGNSITPPPVSTEHPVNAPGFEFSKTADPASGRAVAAGSIVNYTLTGVNTGATDLNEVTITDDLSRVLKHAKYQGDAVAQIGQREAAGVEFADDELLWKGGLAVGETVTVTYSVRVNENAVGQLLENEAVASATPPGGATINPPASATEHPVNSQLAVTGARALPWLALGALLAAGGGLLITRRPRKAVR
uniref:DUF7927 domain-containing protein n=1 Tax=Leucobacter sp. USHLN154 TaxID=3081269 RepID=UPI00301B33EA